MRFLVRKSIKNVRKRSSIVMAATCHKVVGDIADPRTKSFSILNNSLAIISKRHSILNLNKPIYLGRFGHRFLLDLYGEKLKILGSDTDSFFLKITTDDFYKDMLAHAEKFDTSDYPRDHFLYSHIGCKVPGLFKDDTNGKAVRSFVGLKAKLYSMEISDGTTKSTSKGIKKNSAVNHDSMVKCLEEGDVVFANYHSIESRNHVLHTRKIRKLALTNFDVKAYLLDQINTLPNGHCNIPTTEENDDDGQIFDVAAD
uniref:DNA-directed DNA polymerase n=1 Tax=Strigamia maritima TaxID=126957 RepID=T1IJA5_STRMM